MVKWMMRAVRGSNLVGGGGEEVRERETVAQVRDGENEERRGWGLREVIPIIKTW
jgi:hypothetical protein